MYMSPLEKGHTLSVFDAELGQIGSLINEMAELARDALARAMTALATADTESARAVVHGDRKIDDLEKDLEKQVVRSLALRSPMADDLRYLVMAIRIGAMLERAGDHAKNIAKRTQEAAAPKSDALLALLTDMSGLAGVMLTEAVESFNRRDPELATAVRERDAEMNERYDELTRLITHEMQGDGKFVSAGIHLLFVAKQLERTGDYATNIANSVYYMVTGEHFPGWEGGPQVTGQA
jgi:phosphate transport system protein